jgi:hypothetical protein
MGEGRETCSSGLTLLRLDSYHRAIPERCLAQLLVFNPFR